MRFVSQRHYNNTIYWGIDNQVKRDINRYLLVFVGLWTIGIVLPNR